MKSLLTLVLLVASAICALAAPAWATASSTVTVTVSSPSTGCRIAATASVDGCANAPRTGSFLKNCFTPAGAGWINQVSGTTTDWTAGTWHSYNVAGCAEDSYPIGYSVPLSSLKDPLSGGVSVIPGCSYDPTGGRNGNGVLNCGGAAFTGYDGYTTGAIGGHGCLNLVINMPLTTEPTISNFQIKNDGNCLIAGVGSSLTETGTVNHKLHLISGEIDGQGLVYPLSGFAGINGSNIDAKYIAFLDMPSQVVSYRLDDTTTGFSCFACVVKGHNYRGPLGHSEWYGANGNVGAAFENFTYSMIIETTAQQNIGPAPIATSLQSSVPIGSLLLDHVLVSPSHVGGSRNATITSACIAGDPACTTPGDNFYVQGFTGGPIGSGQNLLQSCGGIIGALVYTGGAGTTSAGIGGGGFATSQTSAWGFDLDISSYTITASITGTDLNVTKGGFLNLQVGTTVNGNQKITSMGAAAGQTGDYVVSPGGTVASKSMTASVPHPTYGNWTAPPTKCTNPMSVFSSPEADAVMRATNGDAYGTSQISNVVVDMSTYGPGSLIWVMAGKPGATFTGSIAGTILDVTAMNSGTICTPTTCAAGGHIAGGTISPTEVVVNQIDGTPGGVGHYTVNSSQTIASSALYEGGSSCATKTVFANDIDIARIYTEAQMEGWTGGAPVGSGC